MCVFHIMFICIYILSFTQLGYDLLCMCVRFYPRMKIQLLVKQMCCGFFSLALFDSRLFYHYLIFLWLQPPRCLPFSNLKLKNPFAFAILTNFSKAMEAFPRAIRYLESSISIPFYPNAILIKSSDTYTYSFLSLFYIISTFHLSNLIFVYFVNNLSCWKVKLLSGFSNSFLHTVYLIKSCFHDIRN